MKVTCGKCDRSSGDITSLGVPEGWAMIYRERHEGVGSYVACEECIKVMMDAKNPSVYTRFTPGALERLVERAPGTPVVNEAGERVGSVVKADTDHNGVFFTLTVDSSVIGPADTSSFKFSIKDPEQ